MVYPNLPEFDDRESIPHPLKGWGQEGGEPCEVVEVKPWRKRGYLVGSNEAAHRGLVVHGYGGNSSEMLGLAVDLAARLDLRLLVFDLPGHGSAGEEILTRSTALATVEAAAKALGDPDFFIGHSLGARLGLTARLPVAILLSMPGPASFEGSRSELLKTLRARRVNEPSAFQGLEEILMDKVEPAPKTLLLRARHDLQSVKQLAADWEKIGVPCHHINDSNHNDIVSSPETRKVILDWLIENLEVPSPLQGENQGGGEILKSLKK